jgi:hypothetical protein
MVVADAGAGDETARPMAHTASTVTATNALARNPANDSRVLIRAPPVLLLTDTHSD